MPGSDHRRSDDLAGKVVLVSGGTQGLGSAVARAAAQANEKLAKTTLERYETLFQRRSVSPQEFDEVRASYVRSLEALR